MLSVFVCYGLEDFLLLQMMPRGLTVECFNKTHITLSHPHITSENKCGYEITLSSIVYVTLNKI